MEEWTKVPNMTVREPCVDHRHDACFEAHDLRAVRGRLCNTLATGEANEEVCYTEIEKLTARIAAMESNHGQ